MEATPDGKYILGVVMSGKDTGIYQISIDSKTRTLLIPNVDTFLVRYAKPGGQADLYYMTYPVK